MFKHFDRKQKSFLPQSIDEYVGPAEFARTVVAIVNELDLQPLIEKYDPLGQNAYHPAMMLSLLFFSYAEGVYSSRQIEKQIMFDLRYKYISGGLQPNFRTISDFRKDNLELMRKYFVDILFICRNNNLLKAGQIAIDGTKVAASASRKEFKTSEQLIAELEQVEADAERLLKCAQRIDDDENDRDDPDTPAANELNDKLAWRDKLLDAKRVLDQVRHQKRVNLTDPDCRDQGKIGAGYNCQIAVDCESQLIVGTQVIANPCDNEELLPMINQVEADTDSVGCAKKVYADSGYESGENCMALEERPHLDAYVASKGQHKQSNRSQPPFDKAGFHFDPVAERCVCPMGHPMQLRRCGIVDGKPGWSFTGVECSSCDQQDLCTKAKRRTVRFYVSDDSLNRMRTRMETEAGHLAMKIRRQTVEPVIGQLKECQRLRRFSLRGLTKVQGEFTLAAIGHNLRKLHRFLSGDGLDCAAAILKTFFTAIFRFFVRFVSHQVMISGAESKMVHYFS
jgi:transposase